MSTVDSFPQLIARVRAGDNEAAAVIFERFVNQLAAHAHRHLSPAVRRLTDADDVVQSVYRTFFRRVRRGEFQINNWASLWGLLTRIAVRKCARASRRNGHHGKSVSAPGGDTPLAEIDLHWPALAREPSPDEAAALNDILVRLLDPLREAHREIVKMTLQAYTQEEISLQLGCSERSVRRVLAHVQCELEKLDPA